VSDARPRPLPDEPAAPVAYLRTLLDDAPRGLAAPAVAGAAARRAPPPGECRETE
jgi:hypothetical protein